MNTYERPEVIHSTRQYENDRAGQSHEATRAGERGMRGFKSLKQARRLRPADYESGVVIKRGKYTRIVTIAELVEIVDFGMG